MTRAARTSHGKTKTKIYWVWVGMKSRCLNKNKSNYNNYGAKGVKVQKEWADSFMAFFEYASNLNGYDESNLGKGKLTIDRIDPKGDYCEGNLRWASSVMQNRNKGHRKDNKSGFRGVMLDKRRGTYYACIDINKKRHFLGSHKDPTQAYELRKAYILEHQLEGFEIDLKTGKII